MPRRTPPDVEARIAELVAEGLPAAEVGRRLGIAHTTVLRSTTRTRGAAPPKVKPAVVASTRDPLLEGERAVKIPGLPPAARDWGTRGIEWDGADVRRAGLFLEGLALGMCRVGAAEYAGLPALAVEDWCSRAAAGEEPWASWALVAGEASGAGHAELLRVIRSGRAGWQSAAWLLERTRPATYGRRVEVIQDRAHPLDDVSTDALLSVVERWRKSARDTGSQG
jgi:hypothetical protein